MEELLKILAAALWEYNDLSEEDCFLEIHDNGDWALRSNDIEMRSPIAIGNIYDGDIPLENKE